MTCAKSFVDLRVAMYFLLLCRRGQKYCFFDVFRAGFVAISLLCPRISFQKWVRQRCDGLWSFGASVIEERRPSLLWAPVGGREMVTSVAEYHSLRTNLLAPRKKKEENKSDGLVLSGQHIKGVS